MVGVKREEGMPHVSRQPSRHAWRRAGVITEMAVSPVPFLFIYSASSASSALRAPPALDSTLLDFARSGGTSGTRLLQRREGLGREGLQCH